MSDRKQMGAERLFDAMGMIDDALITEAQTPVLARQRQKRRKRFYTVALTACACLVIAVGLFGNALWNDLFVKDAVNSTMDAPGSAEADADESAATMRETLASTSESPLATVVSPENVELFDGVTKLIWRMEGESEYYVIRMTSFRQIQELKRYLTRGQTAIAPEDTEDVGCSVWVAYGDGTVVSPYLKASEGNVGYGELFEYSPEVEPDEGLIRWIEELAES